MYAFLLLAAASLDGSPSGVPPESAAVVQLGGCSGVCVSPDGLILSSDHCGVASHATFEDGRVFTLDCLYDPPQDNVDQAMVLKCQGASNLPYVTIASSGVHVGDEVYSIGYPKEGRSDFEWEMHRGRVTCTHCGTTNPSIEDEVKCNFPVWGGNSGGPLFNASGEVVGLCSQSDRSSWSSWIGVESIFNSLAQCPGPYCPPIQDNRIIGVDLGKPAPLPPTPIQQLQQPIIPQGLIPLLEQNQTPVAPAPSLTTSTTLDWQSIVLVAATTAGTVFGIPWLPTVVQLVLSIFGKVITDKQKKA